ncbi:TraB pilus assembly family protein [Novosphingobium resinovorum]|uniref:TraB pilus assembly family protein n=1 Tax=Novosphingobium resinovorum TaxID=158500 RepID=A0A031JR70_9SPHN|nr:TraB/VirB10 family protein [Novosphingobium resinovorum]EZP77128.1 TraB pilus assembly family protein [Novosphingobium resinovorum]
MALADIFSRTRRTLDGPDEETENVSPVTGEIGSNEATRKKQRLLLAGVAGAGLVLSSFWIFGGNDKDAAEDDDGEKVEVSTKDLVNRNLSQQEWMGMSENQFQSMENQLKSVNAQQNRVDALAAQVEALKGQNQALQADGQRVFSAYQAENERLKREAAQQRAAPPPQPGPAALYGPGGTQAYRRPDGTPGAAGPAGAPMGGAEVKMVNFQTTETGNASRVAKGNTVYTDSVNYLPPNSFASAKVIVGVDASAGVNSQSDPLPVVLRVTGPARSVFQNGRLLTTKIEGCLINGAARGDLSAEKVYVKLQKMTCPQPGGRYAVSEVKGFIAFGGKTGVRGRVVSREGGLVTQAFIAGLFGGFGRGFSANANSVFQGTNITTNGKRDKLSAGEILEGGFGEGVAQTGDMVSKYLIERAEQYQPVIEMPTGIDVEIVFLEGVYVRN